jgi:hypothetical protein
MPTLAQLIADRDARVAKIAAATAVIETEQPIVAQLESAIAAMPPIPKAPGYAKAMSTDPAGVVLSSAKCDGAAGYWVKLGGVEVWRGTGTVRANDVKSAAIVLPPGTEYAGQMGAYNDTGDGPGAPLKFKTNAAPVAVPPPVVTPPVVERPVPTPPIAVVVIPDETLTATLNAKGAWDGGGKRYASGVDTVQTGAAGAAIRNATLVPSADFATGKFVRGIVVNHPGATIEGIRFPDAVGGGIYVNADDCTIRDVTIAGKFGLYGIYASGWKNVTIDGVTIGSPDAPVSGSTRESAIRFAGDSVTRIVNTGALRNVKVWNFRGAYKQSLRGCFDGTVDASEFHGDGSPVVNLSPLGGGDGGQELCWTLGYSASLKAFATWDNPAAVMAAWDALIAAGETDHRKFFAAAKLASPTINGKAYPSEKITAWDWDNGFVARRATALAEYSNVRFTNTWIDGECGAEPGATLSFGDGCKVGDPKKGVFWKFAKQYPPEDKALPWDVIRPAAKITLGPGHVELYGKVLGAPREAITIVGDDVWWNGQPLK